MRIGLLMAIILLSRVTCVSDSVSVEVSHGGYNFFPSISPDGKYIAYLHEVDNVLGAVGTLWLFNVRTGERVKVSEHTHHELFDSFPAWFPDSKKILFSADDALFTYDVFSKILDTVLVPETPDFPFYGPSISRDGKLVALNVMYSIDSVDNTTYSAVWIWDRQKVHMYELQAMEYDPLTEVVSHRPQWTPRDRGVVTTFFSHSESVSPQIILATTGVDSARERIISDNLHSAFFKILNDRVYYTRETMDTVSLYVSSIWIPDEVKLISNINSSFDIDSENESTRIICSRSDSLFVWQDGIFTSLDLRGHNPQVSFGFLLYESSSEYPEMHGDNSIMIRMK